MKTNNDSRLSFGNYGCKIVHLQSVNNNLCYLLFIVSFLLFGNSYAQLTTNTMEGDYNNKTNTIADTSIHMKSLSARTISEITYLQWLVSDLKQDGVFTVYYSCDGIQYSRMGSIPAIGVPVEIDIAYYYQFNSSSAEDNYYRAIYINNLQSDMEYVLEMCMSDKMLIANQTR